MLVRLNEGTRMAGPDYNVGPGETIKLPDDVAQVLIANQMAVAAEEALPEVETADTAPPEEATAPPQRRRTRKPKAAK